MHNLKLWKLNITNSRIYKIYKISPHSFVQNKNIPIPTKTLNNKPCSTLMFSMVMKKGF